MEKVDTLMRDILTRAALVALVRKVYEAYARTNRSQEADLEGMRIALRLSQAQEKGEPSTSNQRTIAIMGEIVEVLVDASSYQKKTADRLKAILDRESEAMLHDAVDG